MLWRADCSGTSQHNPGTLPKQTVVPWNSVGWWQERSGRGEEIHFSWKLH